MERVPVVIDDQRRGPGRAGAGSPLQGRRVMFAAALALAEVIAYIVARPGALAATLAAGLVLALAIMGISRLRPGFLRDVLWVIAIAQALVVALPVLVGISVLTGLLIVVALLVAILVVAFRMRF